MYALADRMPRARRPASHCVRTRLWRALRPAGTLDLFHGRRCRGGRPFVRGSGIVRARPPRSCCGTLVRNLGRRAAAGAACSGAHHRAHVICHCHHRGALRLAQPRGQHYADAGLADLVDRPLANGRLCRQSVAGLRPLAHAVRSGRGPCAALRPQRRHRPALALPCSNRRLAGSLPATAILMV